MINLTINCNLLKHSVFPANQAQKCLQTANFALLRLAHLHQTFLKNILHDRPKIFRKVLGPSSKTYATSSVFIIQKFYWKPNAKAFQLPLNPWSAGFNL